MNNEIENDIKLLSNFFIDANQSNSELDNYFNIIEKKIYYKLYKSLNNTDYNRKPAFIAECSCILNVMKTIIKMPELIGKTMIGILANNEDEAYLEIMSKFYDKKLYGYSFPTILYNGDNDEIKVINNIDNAILMNKDDFYHITKQCYDYKINLKSFIKCASIGKKINLNNVVFIIFPPYTKMDFEYNSYLLKLLDVIILTDHSKSKIKIKDIKNENIDLEVWLYSKCDSNNSNNNNITVISDINTIVEKIEEKNTLFNKNYLFSSKYIFETSKIMLELYQSKYKYNDILEKINDDIIQLSDKETSHIMKQLRSKILNKLYKSEKSISDISYIIDECEKDFYNFEDKIEMMFPFYNGDFYTKDSYKDCMYYAYINYIQCGDKNKSEIISKKLISKDKDFDYINRLYYDKNYNRPLSNECLNKIRDLYLNSEKLCISKKRALVNFNDELNIKDVSAGGIIYNIVNDNKDILYDLNNHELKLLGDYYLNNNDIDNAIKQYEKASRKGSETAVEKLISIPKYLSNNKNMSKLANMLNRNIMFIYGKRRINDDIAYGMSYIKMSAALENMTAIIYMANYYYNEARKAFNAKKLEEVDNYNKIALELYNYIIENSKNDYNIRDMDFIYTRAGYIYYLLEDYVRALSKFVKVHNNDLAFCTMAIIYEKGLGISKDYDKAIELYEKSYNNFGNEKSKNKYEYLKIEKKKMVHKKETKDEFIYKKVDEKFSHSKFCFITTAACLSLDKGDDCDELNTLRYYRDNHLINDNDGYDLIKEYYYIAPKIVSNINSHSDSVEIYRKLHNDYILLAYKNILNKNYDEAKKIYIDMVAKLKEKYLS